MRLGPWEIALIVLGILVLFGARRIPELMKGLGSGIKEFKKALREEEPPNIPHSEQSSQNQKKNGD